MARKGLGRGLSSLLGEGLTPPTADPPGEQAATATIAPVHSGTPLRLSIDLLSPNPFQPRVEFDEDSLAELQASIENHGILQPLLVREDPNQPGRFQIIAGERRFRAAANIGLLKVPIQVRSATDEEMMEIAIVENVQRDNLNPIEEAKAYRQLMEAASLSQQEVAQKVGKSRPAVANLLRLLDLPTYVQDTIETGEITQGHGKILAGMDPESCKKAWDYATTRGASVRALEEFLKKQEGNTERGKTKPPKKESELPTTETDIHLKDIEEALQERLRTKVQVIYRKDTSGSLHIEFYNREDLERLLESLDIEL